MLQENRISREPVIARIRKADGLVQPLEDHLREVADLSSQFAGAIGLPICGRLLGLIHDLGKYSSKFQWYICAANGYYGEEKRAEAESKKGTIDHASAGAIHIWRRLAGGGKTAALLAQVLASVTMSHHSRTGVKDFINLEGESDFLIRLDSREEKSHYLECIQACERKISEEIERLLCSSALIEEFKTVEARVAKSHSTALLRRFAFGLLVRFLFSCLLDADRLSSANFEAPISARLRRTGMRPKWQELVLKLEKYLLKFTSNDQINHIRRGISDDCRRSASRPGKLFTLSVPTGGGKSLASLRFALHRAALMNEARIDRIIYVVPYTSIIEQNAQEVREILGEINLLEHHSNIVPERNDWRSRVLSENWDAPVVFTTSVQFLNCMFAAGTNTARRMHQLSNSVVIFDEVQALPTKVIHLFNNSVQFLASNTSTTILLCTATMPILNKVNANFGCLPFTEESEIISNKRALFDQLRRTEILDRTRDSGWTNNEVSDLAVDCASLHRTVLIVCNTKDTAKKLLAMIRSKREALLVIHLSTSMCPAHRRTRIESLRERLKPDRQDTVICVSTQLIEAGVDLDFGCVIRSLAGMDSIVQAGGRCNRHGHRNSGFVYILNFAEEVLSKALEGISEAQQDTLRTLDDFRENPGSLGGKILSEECLTRFYEYHYFKRKSQMLYPLPAGRGDPPIVAETSMIALLSENPSGLEAARRQHKARALSLRLHHALSTAGQAFRVIDAPTLGIIVPYEQGTAIIGELCAKLGDESCPLAERVGLLKSAQQYTVNVFPHIMKKLDKVGAVRQVCPGTDVFSLDERYYHDDEGVILDALSEMNFLDVDQ